jgi:hypothetical protein
MSASVQLGTCDHDTVAELRALADRAFSRAAGAPLIGGNSVRLLKNVRRSLKVIMFACSKTRERITPRGSTPSARQNVASTSKATSFKKTTRDVSSPTR